MLTLTIENWEELSRCNSDKYKLEIDLKHGCGWIVNIKDEDNRYYLSTHTFYESTYKYSTKVLQNCGFDIKLVSLG